jgi:hypothetical protein
MRYKVESSSLVTLATCGMLFFAVGCGQPKPAGMPPEKAAELRALQEKRENHATQLHGMAIKQLAQELAADSEKGREPFNSAAYREAISRGEGAAGDLKQTLARSDRSSLLGLLALRHVSATQYHSLEPAFRVNTLTSSLENSRYFNTWGIPNFYWEDAAKALIEEGSAAESSLLKLLRDQRPAPVFGSEGATVGAQFHYRVCDYAWAFLNEIRLHKIEQPADPTERDRLIERTLKEGLTQKHK